MSEECSQRKEAGEVVGTGTGAGRDLKLFLNKLLVSPLLCSLHLLRTHGLLFNSFGSARHCCLLSD